MWTSIPLVEYPRVAPLEETNPQRLCMSDAKAGCSMLLRAIQALMVTSAIDIAALMPVRVLRGRAQGASSAKVATRTSCRGCLIPCNTTNWYLLKWKFWDEHVLLSTLRNMVDWIFSEQEICFFRILRGKCKTEKLAFIVGHRTVSLYEGNGKKPWLRDGKEG